MSKKTTAAIAATLMAFALTGCTLLEWGKPTAKVNEPPVPDDAFKQGEALLAKGKYDQARAKYSTVKESDLDKAYEPLVQIRLGDSYYEEARYAEAEVEYRRFLEMHPQNKAAAYVIYQIGMCSFKQMDKADRDPAFALVAMTQFKKLLIDYPNNPYQDEARQKYKLAKSKAAGNEFIVGKYYYKKGAWKAAASRFQGIVDQFPECTDEPETLYDLADCYIRLGQTDSAKAALARLFQEYPNNRFSAKAQGSLVGKMPASK